VITIEDGSRNERVDIFSIFDEDDIMTKKDETMTKMNVTNDASDSDYLEELQLDVTKVCQYSTHGSNIIPH